MSFGLAISGASAVEYRLDPADSHVRFKAFSRFGGVTGEFRRWEAKTDIDEQRLELSRVNATFDVASLDTRNGMRDRHLRSPDFFDAGKFPTAELSVTRIDRAGDGEYAAEGLLTVRGVSKTVRLPVSVVSFEGGFLRMKGETSVDRKDFHIDYDSRLNPIRNDVKISYELSLKKIEPATK